MLLARERVTPLGAVERLVAMQAQWPRPPFVGLWSRVLGFAREDLAVLLRQRKVVRATFLRATLHLVSAKDFVALRPAIQPVLEGAMQAILRAKGARLDADWLAARARTLLAGEPRTFEELRDLLLRADPKGGRARHGLRRPHPPPARAGPARR